MEWLRTVQEKIYKHLFWFLTITGIVLYLLSRTDYSFVAGYETLLKDFGIAVLSSGVFASVLKSIQFTGIFKKEIENVILESEYLKKRKDLDTVWKKVSRAMYESKFHTFAEDLEEIILDGYLPIKDNLYYKDFFITIHVTDFTDDMLEYSLSTEVNMVPINRDEKIVLEHKYEIMQNSDGTENLQNFIYYTKDDEDIMSDPTYSKKTLKPDVNGKVFSVHSFELNGKSSYSMKRKVERKISIRTDDNIVFRVAHITKNMNVMIIIPENLNATFIDIGVYNEFRKQHSEKDNVMNYVHREGVILPKQGFGISFIKK